MNGRSASTVVIAISLLASIGCSSQPRSADHSDDASPVFDSLSALIGRNKMISASLAADYIRQIDSTQAVLICKAGEALPSIAPGDLALLSASLALLAKDVVGTYNIVMCDSTGRVVSAFRTDSTSNVVYPEPRAKDFELLLTAKLREDVGEVVLANDPALIYTRANARADSDRLEQVVRAVGRLGASLGGSGDVVIVDDQSQFYVGALDAGKFSLATVPQK